MAPWSRRSGTGWWPRATRARCLGPGGWPGPHRAPADRPLAELTAELTTMLGAADPYLRDEIAYPTLATWVSEGVYDELLVGLGDGMTAGLVVGIGEEGTDTVFRRSFSALVLATCIERATTLPPGGA